MTSVLHKRFDPLPVDPKEIPYALQRINRFVVWRAFASERHDGKAAKIPVDITSGRKVSAFDPTYHMPFNDAVEAYEDGLGDGVGIVLDGEPVATAEDGNGLYLVGIDLDNVFDNEASRHAAMAIVAEVGGYAELSPSGRGLRIFCHSKHKPRSGQTKFGEIYAQRRFLTVTGHRIGFGDLVDATDAIKQIEHRWWGTPTARNSPVIPFPEKMLENTRILSGGDWIETDENRRRIEGVLSYIPPDAPYEIWRDCIWALASLDWECGQDLAANWSAQSEAHWKGDGGAEATATISSLFDGFDAGRGITPGTLFHHAYSNGIPRITTPQIGLPSAPSHAPRERFAILSRDDLAALPPMRWIVRGVLPERGLAAIYGEPGSGKSFLALDLGARISSGLPDWFGRKIERRDVIYVALEGGRGIQSRQAAWDTHNGLRAERIKFMISSFSLLSDEDVIGFADAVSAASTPGAVVIIDTLAQATPGADENAGKDMGLALQAAQRISEAVSGLVVLVHHSGKETSRGLRGHSSLNGAMDAVIYVGRDKTTGERKWRITKMKDAEMAPPARSPLRGWT